jgi:hypothetical protein
MLNSVFIINNVSLVDTDNILKNYVEYIKTSVINANEAYDLMYSNDEFESKFYLENINKYEMTSDVDSGENNITVSQYFIKEDEDNGEVEVEVEVDVEASSEEASSEEEKGEEEETSEEEVKEEKGEEEGEIITIYQQFIKYLVSNESSVEEHKDE